MIPQLPPELISQIIDFSIPSIRPCEGLDHIKHISSRYEILQSYALINSIWRDIALDKLVEMMWLRRTYKLSKDLITLLNRNEGDLASRVKSLYIGSGDPSKMLDLPVMAGVEEVWYLVPGIPTLKWLKTAINLQSLTLLSTRIAPNTFQLALLPPTLDRATDEITSNSLRRLSFDPSAISILNAHALNFPNLKVISAFIQYIPFEVDTQLNVIAILAPRVEELQLFQSYIPDTLIPSINNGFKQFRSLRRFTTNNLISLTILLNAIPTTLTTLRLLDQNNSFSAPLSNLLTQLELLPPSIQSLRRIGVPVQWTSYSWKEEVSRFEEWCKGRGIEVVVCKTVDNIRGEDLDLMDW